MEIPLSNSHWPFLKYQWCLGLLSVTPSVSMGHQILFLPSTEVTIVTEMLSALNGFPEINMMLCVIVYKLLY